MAVHMQPPWIERKATSSQALSGGGVARFSALAISCPVWHRQDCVPRTKKTQLGSSSAINVCVIRSNRRCMHSQITIAL